MSNTTLSSIQRQRIEYLNQGNRNRGIGGYLYTWITNLTEFRLFDEEYILDSPVQINDLGSQYSEGIVGYGLLKDALLVIDYRHNKISITKL